MIRHRVLPLSLLIILSAIILLFACRDDSPTDPSNGNPPNAPSNPSPDSGATGVGLLPQLVWDCTDPDGDPLVFDVYFGTSQTPPLIRENWPNKNYQLADSLNRNQTYYWRIIAEDINSNTTNGPVWAFSSYSNQDPNPPTNLLPANDSTDVPVDIGLSWECTDPDGDSLYYEVYFDTLNPPSLIEQNWAGTSYTFSDTLNHDTQYYWKIVAIDELGDQSESDVLTFTTLRGRGIYLVSSIETSSLVMDVFKIRDELYFTQQNNSFQIYDVSNPATPFYSSTLSYTSLYAKDIYVEGNFAYLPDSNSSGMLTVDISNPFNPIVARYMNTPDFPHALAKDSNWVFMACDSSGMLVADVYNPYVTVPVDTFYIPDAIIESIDIIANYAVLGTPNRGIYIVDIADPADPVLLSNHPTLGEVEDVFVQQVGSARLVHIADGSRGYRLVDITNPFSPSLVTTLYLPGYSYNLYSTDDYTYVASGIYGMYIIDNSDPSQIVDTYNSEGLALAVTVVDGYIYLSDGEMGVKLLEFEE